MQIRRILDCATPRTTYFKRPKETKTMLKSKKKLTALSMAVMTLMLAGVAGFAQRHFMLANAARPEVNVQLAGAVERDSKLIPLEKSTVVNPGEILDWNISAQNNGNAAALEYKTVGHVPRGTEFVAGSAKADGAKTQYSIDGGKSFSPQPMIEVKQEDGSVKRVPAPSSMYTEIRYEWSDPLVQGGKLSASYKVRVK
jgi:uncharacterized repeat protein (TIGR01451 family)